MGWLEERHQRGDEHRRGDNQYVHPICMSVDTDIGGQQTRLGRVSTTMASRSQERLAECLEPPDRK
ncbi:hypothetical protein CFAM422_005760 [Trichoderma lentiforme]|uniref:Uncharacterized protein n=1 Tax=Trichoderma lentiforme TaxID=1567552 RepID=A0A9P4XG27_9HYPO|nr:hypothetical protein CFAM422_005760 [Trichoderma lentiforme]